MSNNALKDPFKYIKVFLMGRPSPDGVAYASMNRRMLAALIDICIMMFLLQPMFDLWFEFSYPKPAIDEMHLKDLMTNASVSDSDAQALRLYATETGLWRWIVATSLMQLCILCVLIVLCWFRFGATPGKMLVRVRIVQRDTLTALSLSQACKRMAGYFISALCLMLGFFSINWDKKRRGWHDKIAGTVVICSSFKPTIAAADPSNSLAP